MSCHVRKGLSAAATLSFQKHGRGLAWAPTEPVTPQQLSQHTTPCKSSYRHNPLIFIPLPQSIYCPSRRRSRESCLAQEQLAQVLLEGKDNQKAAPMHCRCEKSIAERCCHFQSSLPSPNWEQRGPNDVQAQSTLMNESTCFFRARLLTNNHSKGFSCTDASIGLWFSGMKCKPTNYAPHCPCK